jgi:hypothetical protein
MSLKYAMSAGLIFLLLSGCAGIEKPAGTASATLTIEGSLASYYAGALSSLQDFPGKYTSHRKGITVGKGEFTALLKSDRGVQIYLEGEATGVGSSMGMSSVEIELK